MNFKNLIEKMDQLSDGKQVLSESTGATDYKPKSQGGTRSELLAKYAKSGSAKDAEACRKAGCSDKEMKDAREKAKAKERATESITEGEGLGYSKDPEQGKWYHAGRRAVAGGTTGDIREIAKKAGCPPKWLDAFLAGYEDQQDFVKKGLSEATKETGKGRIHKGHYGRHFDTDEEGLEKKKEAMKVKRGRGRPKKDADKDFGDAPKFDFAKDLQSFMVGNLPGGKLPGKASVKHKIKDEPASKSDKPGKKAKLKDWMEHVESNMLTEAEKITIMPAKTDAQVIMKDNQVLGQVTNPTLAAAIKSAISKGEMTLAGDDLTEDDMMEVAPPGMQDVVDALEKKFPGQKGRAYAIAWSMHNKKHGKKAKADESVMESTQQPVMESVTLEDVLSRYPHEHKMCQEGWGMDEGLYEALCDHYHKEGRIPYKVWHGPLEELRKHVEECYMEDTNALIDEGMLGSVAGGIAGAALGRSPSAAMMGAKVGDQLQDMVVGEEIAISPGAMEEAKSTTRDPSASLPDEISPSMRRQYPGATEAPVISYYPKGDSTNTRKDITRSDIKNVLKRGATAAALGTAAAATVGGANYAADKYATSNSPSIRHMDAKVSDLEKQLSIAKQDREAIKDAFLSKGMSQNTFQMHAKDGDPVLDQTTKQPILTPTMQKAADAKKRHGIENLDEDDMVAELDMGESKLERALRDSTAQAQDEEMMEADKWIAGAIKKPGAFTAKAERHGMTTAQFSDEVLSRKDDYPAKTEKQAVLAKTLRGLNEDAQINEWAERLSEMLNEFAPNSDMMVPGAQPAIGQAEKPPAEMTALLQMIKNAGVKMPGRDDDEMSAEVDGTELQSGVDKPVNTTSTEPGSQDPRNDTIAGQVFVPQLPMPRGMGVSVEGERHVHQIDVEPQTSDEVQHELAGDQQSHSKMDSGDDLKDLLKRLIGGREAASQNKPEAKLIVPTTDYAQEIEGSATAQDHTDSADYARIGDEHGDDEHSSIDDIVRLAGVNEDNYELTQRANNGDGNMSVLPEDDEQTAAFGHQTAAPTATAKPQQGQISEDDITPDDAQPAAFGHQTTAPTATNESDDLEEGGFQYALAQAAKAGEKTAKIGGKEFPVKMSKSAAEKIVDEEALDQPATMEGYSEWDDTADTDMAAAVAQNGDGREDAETEKETAMAEGMETCNECGAMYEGRGDDHVCETHDEEHLTEWANSPVGKSEDEEFTTEMEFMTKLISGGLNNIKRDQTVVPSARVKTETEVQNPQQSIGALIAKLNGIN